MDGWDSGLHYARPRKTHGGNTRGNFPAFSQYVAFRRISMYSRLLIGSYFLGRSGPKHPGTQSTVFSESAPMKYGME
ncbi:flavonol synthase/flavanone 3-hydroxylase [Colletotrichum asianum]